MSVYDKKFCFCGRSKDFKKMMTFIVVALVILSQFVGNVHASTCHNNTCVENTYFSETLECVQCPSGKSSRAGAIFCSKCDTMYLLSTHCTFPVLGLILLGVFIITMMAVLYSFYRYRHRQEEIKRRLRIDLYRHKRLVKTKQTDISLLTSAWYLSEDEVRLDKKIASGASGDVWKGALRSNWVVAIKKVKTSNMNARRRKSSATSPHRRRRHSSLIDKQLQRGIKEGENTNKNSGWVFDIEEGTQICWPVKLQYEIFQLFATRYRLHKQVYNHPNVKACEFVIVDMLKKVASKVNLAIQGDSIIYCKYLVDH